MTKNNIFSTLRSLGYPNLVPIIPADATLSEQTKVRQSDCGKVPGRKTPHGWTGFAKWTEYQSTAADDRVWKGWGAGVGICGGKVLGFDVDITDEKLSKLVQKWLTARLGHAPCRTGRQPKALLVYRCTEELHKRRFAFTAPDGTEHAVELLAKGQQFVAHGVHPSGKRYSWDTETKTLPPYAQLIELTPEMVDEVWENMIAYILEELGCSIVESSITAAATRTPVGDPALMGDPEQIEDALKYIPNKQLKYDEWIRMCAAIKAALGGDEGCYGMFAEWCAQYEGNSPDDIRKRWDSVSESSLGASYVIEKARDYGYNDAANVFEADPDAKPGDSQSMGVDKTVMNARDAMMTRYIWCEEVQRFIDTETGHLLAKDALNAREAVAGNPTSSKTCASMVYLRDIHRRQVVWGMTYRPGGEEFYEEQNKGLCYNTYRPSRLKLPEVVTDEQVAPWLRLVEHVLPDPEARQIVLDWCTHTLRSPEEKINWALLIGSTAQGIGKDMMFQPLIAGVGEHNVSYVSPDDLASGYTDWAADAKLVVVEEMMAFHRKEMMNRLKAFIAAPPDYIRVNKKFVPQYDIPNVGNHLFFTNIHNALALEREDRRFYVYWSPARPRDPKFYSDIVAFYKHGGKALVARWLHQREVAESFNAGGAAPWSKDKDEMRRAGLDPVAEWVENCIEDGIAPFDTCVISINHVMRNLPMRIERLKPSSERITHLMRSAGADALCRVRYEGERTRFYAVRRHQMYEGLGAEEVKDVYEAELKRASAKKDTAFFDEESGELF